MATTRGYYSTSLHVGGEDERNSAKKRRQDGYKADLQLQMQERYAAKQRERLQDMSVDASGYLDPEKGPERLKPLGGVDWTQYRSKGDSKVRPYHTLFLYEEQKRPQVVVHRSVAQQPVVSVPAVQMVPQRVAPPPVVHRVRLQGAPRTSRYPSYEGPVFRDPIARHREPFYSSSERADLGKLDPPRQVTFREPVAPPQQIQHYHQPYDQAYNMMAARDITLAPAAPLVQPLQPIHYPDTRPIIIQQPAPSYDWHGPRYNPFPIVTEMPSKNSTLLLEEARLKIKLERDNEEHKRRLQRELDENQRRLRDSEAEARRRLEELRLESENRRREAERQRREWERLLRLKELERPRSIPVVVKPGSGRNRLLDDMDLYRMKLREERKMIEELLMNRRPIEPPRLDIKVIRKEKETVRQEIPPTPQTADNANPENVHIFTDLKHRDFPTRRQFRSIFPEVPYTNVKLEWQQAALLKQQEEALLALKGAKTDTEKQTIMKKYFFSRPVWMDREITPFGRLRRRGYTTNTMEVDSRLSRCDKDGFGFRSHRPNSADTLCDDTWMRPSSADV